MLLGAEKITRLRFSESIGADGRPERTLEDESTIRASIQPISGRQRQALPEGIRQTVDLRLYTKSELRTADDQQGVPADHVVIDGEAYRVVQVQQWRQLMAHYQVDVERLGAEDDPDWEPDE